MWGFGAREKPHRRSRSIASSSSPSRAARDTTRAMSQENQRTIAERAGVRWPSMAPRTMQWVLRLRPGSRVRKAMLERFARTAFLSWNRGDYALVPILDDPE